MIKNIIIVFLLLIIIGIAFVAVFIFGLFKGNTPMPILTATTTNTTVINNSTNTPQIENTNQSNNTDYDVFVTLGYPSAGIPKLNVYLKEVGTNKLYKIIAEQNQSEVKFSDVEPGNYVAYAYTFEPPVRGGAKLAGGYTEFSTCGLKASCPSHKLIPININKTFNTKLNSGNYEIQITDWYGAEIPNEN